MLYFGLKFHDFLDLRTEVKSFFINLLTITRIISGGLIFFSVSFSVLLVISIWAGISDFLDGFLARRFNSTTGTGALLDQIADKIFHFTMFIYLFFINSIHLYFIILFAIREIVIIIARQYNLSNKRSSLWGKLKTALSYCFIIYLFTQKVFVFSGEVFNKVPLVFEVVIILLAYSSLFHSLKSPSPKSR
jgi:CDP-diacylglycerol--glycerol-3-phosphate 3-phosphatidyltransferase